MQVKFKLSFMMDQHNMRGRRRGRALLQTFSTFAAGFFCAWLFIRAPWLKEGRKVGVVFGDSITQHGFVTTDGSIGWVGRLSNHFSRRMDIFNRGFSGYTTRDAIAIWPTIAHTLPPKLDLVVIFFGANDAILHGAGPQSVELHEFSSNLERIVSLVGTRNTNVVLVTPPPIYDVDLQERNRARAKPVLLDRTNDNTKKYADAVVQVGTRLSVPVVDLFHLALPNPKSILSDGLHLNAPGNELLYKILLVELERLGLDNLKRDFE